MGECYRKYEIYEYVSYVTGSYLLYSMKYMCMCDMLQDPICFCLVPGTEPEVLPAV